MLQIDAIDVFNVHTLLVFICLQSYVKAVKTQNKKLDFGKLGDECFGVVAYSS